MAEEITEIMTKEERNNTERILAQREASVVLSDFLNLGFRSYGAFRTICRHYDTALKEEDLITYWRLRKIIPGMNERIREVLVKLKTE